MPENIPLQQLSPALDALESAWQELQKFGEHEGPCNFGPPCTECGTHSGRCDHHAAAMASRRYGMDVAIADVLVLARGANSIPP